MWRSLVARVVRDDEVAGSNPVIPTASPGSLDRGFVVPAAFLWRSISAADVAYIEATPTGAGMQVGGRFLGCGSRLCSSARLAAPGDEGENRLEGAASGNGSRHA